MAKEIHERDGVRYEVEVAECGGSFAAIGRCQACPGVSGETYCEYLMAEGAMRAAKALLFSEHHSRAHVVGGGTG